MWRAALTSGCLIAGSGAAAQELRDSLVDLLRANDCSLTLERIEGVFTVMGYPAAEVEAVVDGLLGAGEAGLSPDRRRALALSPALCEPPGRPVRPVEAVGWIEERIAAALGCRVPLADLGREAEAAGVAAKDFDRVARDLAALGRLVPIGPEVGLRPDLCGPERVPDRQLGRIEALGTESWRAVIGFLAMERGCRLSLADRPALLRDLGAMASERLSLGRDLSPDAAAALERRIAEVLDNPGPAYQIDGAKGELVALHCTP